MKRDLPYHHTGLNTFKSLPFASHLHDEVEITVFMNGAATMLFGGNTIRIPSNHLVIHWGALPHQVMETDPGVLVVGLHLPLAVFLEWDMPADIIESILHLDVIVDQERQTPSSDIKLLEHWHEAFQQDNNDLIRMVLLEVQARLLQLSFRRQHLSQGHSSTVTSSTSPTAFEKSTTYIAQHFREPLRIPDIAAASGLSTNHLMRTFRKITGSSINEHITHLRVSYAQSLLIATSQKVIDIMNDAGFSCSTHFYKVFKKYTGVTPGKYRSIRSTNAF